MKRAGFGWVKFASLALFACFMFELGRDVELRFPHFNAPSSFGLAVHAFAAFVFGLMAALYLRTSKDTL
jgi:hypothetical protein